MQGTDNPLPRGRAELVDETLTSTSCGRWSGPRVTDPDEPTGRPSVAHLSFVTCGASAVGPPGPRGLRGTPLQRERASQWGVDLAESQQKQGHVLPSLTVARLFDAALPKIVTG